MSDNKKYYYLRLIDHFFDRPEIKAIEAQENGYEYICIMQKMYLRSLCRGGKLMITDTIPYDLPVLSRVLGHKQETVESAVNIFKKLGLCEIMSDNSIYMTEIQLFIGESSSEADRIRKYRERINANKMILLEGCTNVQETMDISSPEIELELDIKKEIEIELDKPKRTTFIPPTIDEVKTYLSEKSITCIDSESFIAYYEARGWMLGKNKVKDWHCLITTWVKNNKRFDKNTTQTKAVAGSNTQEFIERLNNKKYTGPELEIPEGL